jgi:hypothetical protein
MQPGDCFAYIAFGRDHLYHRGALLSALRLLHYLPSARIRVLTDRPQLFDGYPVETILLTPEQIAAWSFGGRYLFGIKGGGVIELLKRCDRLFVLDTDMYPKASLAGVFDGISPTHSIMWRSEGRLREDYHKLAGKGIFIGYHEVSGSETMWASGVLGVDRANLPLLEAAHAAVGQMISLIQAHTPEQFCTGVALSHDGRTISPIGKLPIGSYSSSGQKAFARKQIESFFRDNAGLRVGDQIDGAAALRLWRGPLEFWGQRHQLVRRLGRNIVKPFVKMSRRRAAR